MTVVSPGTEADSGPAIDDSASFEVRAHLGAALVFLVVGALTAAVAALSLVWPAFTDGLPYLHYGRLRPAAWDLFLYGWLSIALFGVAHHVVPRLAGVDEDRSPLRITSLALLVVGAATGAIAVLMGAGQAKPLLEMPWWAAVVYGLGILTGVVSLTRAAKAAPERLGASEWFLVAGAWWFLLAWVGGNLPGFRSFHEVIQVAFYRAAVTGLWFAVAAVGVAYYLVPRLAGRDPHRPTPLTLIAFWSIGLLWGATAPADLVYGPGPEWWETIGIAASIGLLVPGVVVVYDVVVQMSGRWQRIRDRVTLRLVALGAGFFLAVPVVNLVLALRTSSAVVRFTRWVPAYDLVAYFGAFTLWALAATYHLLGEGRGPRRPRLARWHVHLTTVGLVVAAAAAMAGGLSVGFTWAAGSNSGLFVDAGDGWISTIRAAWPFLVVEVAGWVVFGLAQVLGLLANGGEAPPEAEAPELDHEEIDLGFVGTTERLTLGRLLGATLGLFALVALVVWTLPSLDPGLLEPTLRADSGRYYLPATAEARGRALYGELGCAACHSQQVRAAIPDVGLGPVSAPGDYLYENPPFLGRERIGPDLMHVASRISDPEAMRALLVDPRSGRPWSSMPDYGYLSPEELDALVSYLMTLR